MSTPTTITMTPESFVRGVQRHFLEHDDPACSRQCHLDGAREWLGDLASRMVELGTPKAEVAEVLKPYYDALDGAA